MENLWAVVVVGGPLLLLGVMIWAWLRNRGMSSADKARSDAGTRQLREDMAREPDKTMDL